LLGFTAERPDNDYGVGPDVLWLLDDETGLIIEAKSRKNAGGALTKTQHGQLLNAAEWFKETYPKSRGVRVSVHPNVKSTKSTVTGESKALTFDKLNELISNARKFFTTLCESSLPDSELVTRCEQLLPKYSLTPELLVDTYLVPFQADS
jgi:hypothetical protein